jgi:hypothetical protein
MRRAIRWSFLLWGVLAGSPGCGHSAGSTGSNTNWLTRCSEDGECGARGVCWCGACTKSCADAAQCGDGSCQASDELGCGTPSGQSVCVAVCATSADCPSEDDGLECVNGACLPAVSAGGAAGSGAEAGGGGLGSGARSSAGSGAGGMAAGVGGAAGGGGTAGGPPIGAPLVPDGEQLAVSGGHACYVWSNGSQNNLECWGSNLFGQSSALLPGTVDVTVDAPRRVVNVTDPVAVAVNEEHSCALTAAGDVYCWGFNDQGQIGAPSAPENTCPSRKPEESGDYYACQPEPQRVEGVANAVRIGVSRGRSCALLADGTVRCWGAVDAMLSEWLGGVSNARSLAVGASGVCVTDLLGQHSCSFPLAANGSLPSLQAMALSRDSAVPGGFGCTLGTDRLVRCVGEDLRGELGTGMLATEGLPVALSDVTAIAVGVSHACALGNDAKVRCWGSNTGGAVGTPPRTSPVCGGDYCEALPLEVAGLPPIAAIGAGSGRTCAAATDRTLWCWGSGEGPASESVTLERVGGPWEPGPAECWDRVSALTTARRRAIMDTDRTCATDADCATVSVDWSCAHSCALESVAVAAARALEDSMTLLGAYHCADSSPCAVPSASCVTKATLPVCVFGTCTQAAPDHSGCDDACGCAAVVAANSTGVWQDECPGFDLWPIVGGACGECENATSAIVVGNRGGATFNGSATLSFEHIDGAGDAPELPEPVTVTLHLAPGAVSDPIHVRSAGAGGLTVRVSATGDCNGANDASAFAEFPEPASSCE